MDNDSGTLADDDLERLRYPIGRFRPRSSLSESERTALIDDIAAVPAGFREAVSKLTSAQLGTRYRPGGWTVTQVIHHVPDSHMNAYLRFKLAVTEHEPSVKSYNEVAWAELIDGRAGDIETSLVLLEMLHRRWTRFLRSLSAEQLRRALHHPEQGRVTLEHMLQLYAWHGRHHLAHVRGKREGQAGGSTKVMANLALDP